MIRPRRELVTTVRPVWRYWNASRILIQSGVGVFIFRLFVMDQQAQSDLPVFNWGDFTDFHQSPPLLPESGTSEVPSVLSARSYLLPESHNPQNAQGSAPSPSRSDLALELASSSNRTDTNQTPLSKTMAPRPQKRQRGGSKKAAPAKDRRAPRGAGESKENPEEVRRAFSQPPTTEYSEHC